MSFTGFLLRIISYTGLALSVIPALFIFGGTISRDTYFQLMALGMALWFSTAILWVKPDTLGD